MQYNFLRFVVYKSGHGISRADHDCGSIMSLLNLRSLESRRIKTGSLSLYKLINSVVLCFRLFELINFYAPTRSFRFTRYFLLYRYGSLLANSDPVNRIWNTANSYCTCFDSFGVGIDSFRNSLRRIL